MLRPAGFVYSEENKETTADSLRFAARPETPPHIKKFRKSQFEKPGSIVIHHGLLDSKIDKNARYGKINLGEEHVDQVFTRPPTEFQEKMQMKTEELYRTVQREPLGKSYVRGHSIPEEFKKGKAFGVPSGVSETSSGDLIHAGTVEETEDVIKQYKKSHKSYDPGEQRTHDYEWDAIGIDPVTHRFGRTGDKRREGTAECICPGDEAEAKIPKIVCKKMADFKNTRDIVGKARTLGQAPQLPPDYTFGKATGGLDEPGVAECLEGIPFAAQDPSLGRPVRRIDAEIPNGHSRTFGLPTIRRDVPQPAHVSIADGQNYGDDADASQLLYPSRFAGLGISETEFTCPRDAEDIREIFEAIGYTLTEEQFERIWEDASCMTFATAKGDVSVEEFRRALNSRG